MSFSRTPSSINLTLIVPALVVLAVNWLAFQSPQYRQLGEATAKLNKVKANISRADAQADAIVLAEQKLELSRLTSTFQEIKSSQARLISQNSTARASIFGTAAPARATAELLATLERHGIRCLSCSEIGVAGVPEPQSPSATSSTNSRTGNSRGHEILLTLQGSFSELRLAIAELANSNYGLSVISLEMSESDGSTPSRLWKLTVAV